MALVLIIIVVVLAAVAVGVPLYLWLGRRARGSLRLDIPAATYRPGDYIEGTVHLEAKKELGPGRVVVSLVCTEEWWEWDTDSDGDQTRRRRTKEVYRHEIDVVANLSVGAGERRPVPFTLPTPPPTIPGGQQRSGILGFMKSLAEIIQPDRDQIWEVEARYDIPGLDLVGDRRIDLVDDRG